MSVGMQLSISKKKLFDAVGDDLNFYLQNLKLWFREKITKEEFDIEARKIITAESLHLHNDFLLAFLNKCQSLCSAHSTKEASVSNHNQNKDKQKKGKIKRKSRPARATFEHRFQIASLIQYTPQAVAKDPQEDNRLSFCARDCTLPDISMVHGRMFVTAWDSGLDGVEDDAVRLMMLAVQQQLKTIIMAVLSRRNAYKLRDRKFQYGMGIIPSNPYIRNASKISTYMSNSNATCVSSSGDHVPAIRPTLDWAEGEVALQVACDIPHKYGLSPVSASDLLEALQVHRSCVASHTVYAINLERIITKLWHPSHQELEQEDIHLQEENLKKQILDEQITFG